MKQKLLQFFKKAQPFISGLFLLFLVGSCLFIYGRYVYFHPIMGFIILFGCFWLAFYFRDGNWIKWVFIFPVIAMAVFLVNNGSPYRMYLDKLLFKGRVVNNSYEVNAYTDSDGIYNPDHTETEREFVLSPSESKTQFKIVENIINLLALCLIALMYFILNNWKLKIVDT
jgi:hypothetical protein